MLLVLASCASARTEWRPVAPEDVAAVRPASDPDAPAIVLSWDIDFDDRGFPAERNIVEYIRYKIFDPDKAAALTRLSEISVSFGIENLLENAFQVRVTSPDGRTRDFGKEAIHERILVQGGAEQSGFFERLFSPKPPRAKEQVLAVGGLNPGDLVDIRIEQRIRYLAQDFAYSLQKTGVPVRSVRWTMRLPSTAMFSPSVLLGNPEKREAVSRFDKDKNTLVVTASNLPALTDEPLSPSLNDRSVTLFGAYSLVNQNYIMIHLMDQSIHLRPEDGRLAPLANAYYLQQQDAAFPQRAVEDLERTLVAGATTDIEKARRIHDYVGRRVDRFRLDPRYSRYTVRYRGVPLADVIDFDKNPDEPIMPIDFQWLAIALYRAAGFKADTILLADKRRIRFGAARATELFLNQVCARVEVAGAWKYSLVVAPTRVAFGELPWPYRGQQGLLVKEGKQEFVEVPDDPPSANMVLKAGDLTLGPDGSMVGTATETLTGDLAEEAREVLRPMSEEDRRAEIARSLKQGLGDCELEVLAVQGLEDVGAPILVRFTIKAVQYATVTGKRIIFSPSFFRRASVSPFSAAVRRNDVVFPFREEDKDLVKIHVPAGYALEAPSAPASLPGPLVTCKISLGCSPARRLIVLKRDYVLDLDGVHASSYSIIKNWFDRIARSDRHELILLRRPEPDGAGQTAPSR